MKAVRSTLGDNVDDRRLPESSRRTIEGSCNSLSSLGGADNIRRFRQQIDVFHAILEELCVRDSKPGNID